MAEGLASTMVYGDGSGNNTKSYYAGSMDRPKKGKKMACKKKPKKK